MPFKLFLAFFLPVFVLLCGFLGYLADPAKMHTLGIVSGLVIGFLLAAWISGAVSRARKEEEAHHATKAAEQELAGKPNDAVAIAQANMARLNEYYNLNKSQAWYSFIASITAVTIGFGVILLAIFHFKGDSGRVTIGTVSGILLQFIGGAFFVMYNKSRDQLNLFYGKLVRLQDTMLAVQQCDLLSQESKDRVREAVIIALVNRHSTDRPEAQRSSDKDHKETQEPNEQSKAATA